MKRPISLTIKVYLAWAIYMPVVAISYFIAWLDRMLQFRLSFPRDVAQLTHRKDWLFAQLQRGGAIPPSAIIDSCEIKALDQSAIFRSDACIVTIQYTEAGAQHTFKCFAKFAPTMGTVWNKTIFNLQLNHIKEAWFNEYFVRVDAGVPAPIVYCARVSFITGHLCLITEFMADDMEYKPHIPFLTAHLRGDISLYESGEAISGQLADFPQAHLDLVLDGLASLHAQYWGDTSKRMSRVIPIEDLTVYFFDSMVARSWSVPARQVLVRSWCLMNRPQTVLHGDARVGNMMFPSLSGHGRYVLIDWQAVRRGVGAFDLAYFLVLSLSSRQRIAAEQASVDSYYELLLSKGVKDYSRLQLEEDYRHGCLCTLVLLALPMLSGEASVEGLGAQIFVFGMGTWWERLRICFAGFDYAWMADHYNLTEQQSRDAVAEMLAVIETRMDKILRTTDTRETISQILGRSRSIPGFDI